MKRRMQTYLSRTGDIISLDSFYQDFLAAILDEHIPSMLTVSRAMMLVDRVRAGAKTSDYDALIDEVLTDIEALWTTH